MRKKIALIVTAFLLATFLISCNKASEPEKSTIDNETSVTEDVKTENKGLTSFKATDLDGNEVDQTIFENAKLTMINIWGTFCSPCLKEMPDLGELAVEYKDKDLQIMGIVIDTLNNDGSISESQVDKAKEVVEKTKAGYLHLLPSEDLIIAKLAEVSAVPETIFVDKDGNLVGDSILGARSKDDWVVIIEERLKEVEE